MTMNKDNSDTLPYTYNEYKAAEIVRNHAKENGITDVANQELETIIKELRIVWQRHGLEAKTKPVWPLT
jgi:hypothetical protein